MGEGPQLSHKRPTIISRYAAHPSVHHSDPSRLPAGRPLGEAREPRVSSGGICFLFFHSQPLAHRSEWSLRREQPLFAFIQPATPQLGGWGTKSA
jgi:hypothetical protein